MTADANGGLAMPVPDSVVVARIVLAVLRAGNGEAPMDELIRIRLLPADSLASVGEASVALAAMPKPIACLAALAEEGVLEVYCRTVDGPLSNPLLRALRALRARGENAPFLVEGVEGVEVATMTELLQLAQDYDLPSPLPLELSLGGRNDRRGFSGRVVVDPRLEPLRWPTFLSPEELRRWMQSGTARGRPQT